MRLRSSIITEVESCSPSHPGRYFGNSAQFWLDLQSQYDIAAIERDRGAEIARRVRPANAA